MYYLYGCVIISRDRLSLGELLGTYPVGLQLLLSERIC